jgi:hypothetical protein
LENVPNNTNILATSRYKSNLDDEKFFHIKGLTVEEGKVLFLQLIKEYVFEILNGIEELCRRTDGYPFSKELLARSYKGRGLNEINSMMAHLGTEVINPKAEDKRLRSLELCFDYSLNRLSKKNKESCVTY